MTYSIITPSNFTGSGLPILKNDPILPQGNGALFLYKPDADTDTGYVTSTSGTVYNKAWQDAANIIAGGTESNLMGVTSRLFATTPNVTGISEKTSKGGLHIIPSQVNAISGHGMSIGMPSNIRQYLITNSAHTYFSSMWVRVTRADINNTNQMVYFQIANLSAGITNRLILFNSTANSPTGGRGSTLKNLGTTIRNAGPAGWLGTVPSNTANTTALYQVGNKDIFQGANLGQSGSLILYKLYIEDLTVSGRTYADIDVIDNNLYTSAFSVGGKFYGDTFTNPSTLP